MPLLPFKWCEEQEGNFVEYKIFDIFGLTIDIFFGKFA